MDIGKEFSTNVDKEEQGVEVEIGDAKIIVARTTNKAYGKLVTSLFTKHKKTLDLKNDAADTLSSNLMAEVVGTTILRGWSGITENGADLPFSKENAIRLCRIKDFRALVLEKANDFALYKQFVDEEVLGN